MPWSDLTDLPIAVALAPPLRDEVVGWVEQQLGWQVVPLEGPPRPALALVEPGELPGVRCPAVVVVDGSVDAEAVRAAVAAGAHDALGWPADRERLRGLSGLTAAGESGDGRREVLVVAGVGGGVGTSTVALAVAGLAAWAGLRAIACGGDDLLALAGLPAWRGPGGADLAGLGGHAGAEVAGLAVAVAGVPGLLVLGRGRGVREADGWPADLVVVDAGPLDPDGGPAAPGGAVGPRPAAGPAGGAEPVGAPLGSDDAAGGATAVPPSVGDDPGLVVARPDARVLRWHAAGAPLVLVGHGPVPTRVVARHAGRPAVVLPWSSRVAAAAVRGRVPAALPGSWLRHLWRAAVRLGPVRRVRR